MAQYDGSIRINTEINSKNANAQLMSLENRIVKTADKIASLRSKMDSLKDAKIPTQEYQNLQKELDKATQELQKMVAQDSKLSDIGSKIRKLAQSAAEYAEKMRQIGAQKIPTQEYADVQKQIESTKNKIDKLKAAQERFLATGGNTSSSAYKRMQYDIEELEKSLPYLNGELKDLVASGKAFTLGTDTEQYKNLSAKYEQVNQELEKQKALHSEIAQKQADAVQKTIELKAQMNQLVEEGKAFTLGSETEEYAKLGQQLQYAENDLSALNQKHSELISKQKGVSSGFNKLANSAKKAFSKINSIISKAISAIKKFGSFLKKGFSGSNKSNAIMGLSLKNILKYGLGIRSLYALFNKLRSAVKEGYENLYNDNERFKNSVDSLKASVLTLKNSFAAAFRPLVDIAIPYIQKVMDYMSELLNNVGQFLAAITGQKTYTKAIRQTTKAFKDAKKAAEGYLSPLDEINKYQTSKSANTESGTGVMFEEVPIETRFENIAQWFKEMWENADFTELGALLGEKLRDALNNIPWEDIKEKGKEIGKSLATLINGFVKTEGLSKSIGKTIGETINTGVSTAKSFIENTHFYEIGKFVAETANSAMKTTEWGELAETISLGIEGALDTAIGFLDNFEWEEFVQSIEEFLAGIDWGGILGRLGLIILEVFRGVFSIGNKLGVDLTSSLAEFFHSIGWDSVAGFFEGLSKHIESWGKAGKLGFEKVIQWVKDLLGIHSPSTVFAEIGVNVVKGFMNGLSDLKDKVVEVFNQTKEAAKKPINAIISLVETLANGVIDGINTVISALNGLSLDIPDWLSYVPGASKFAGKSFGFNIPELSKVSIPRLATGTVVPPNREFMAVLGDNKREPEVVSPISTIEQAVENVMSRMRGIGGNGNLTLKVYLEDSQLLNPKKIFEAVITEGKVQQMSSGKNRLLLEN